MSATRKVKLFRNGRNQAIRIPRDLELPGNEATIRKEEGRLLIEPVQDQSLLEWLSTIEPWDEEFPEIEELPLEDVNI